MSADRFLYQNKLNCKITFKNMNPQLVTLINKLIEKTQNQAIQWHKTSKPDQYSLSFNKYAVTIEYDEPLSPFGPRYQFHIIDNRGNDVDSVLSGGNYTPQPLIETLYELARRNANHIDSVIGDILRELN